MRFWIVLSAVVLANLTAQEPQADAVLPAPFPGLLPPAATVYFRFVRGLPSGKKGKAGKPPSPKVTLVPNRVAKLRIVEERYFPAHWELRGRGKTPARKPEPFSRGPVYADTALGMLGMGVFVPVRRAAVAMIELQEEERRRQPRGPMLIPGFAVALDIGLIVEAELVALWDGTPSLQGEIIYRFHAGWSGGKVQTAERGVIQSVQFPQIVTSRTRFQVLYTETDRYRTELAWPGQKPIPIEIEVDPHFK